MKKSDELMQAMVAKKSEVENFQKDNKIEDAVKAADELKILNQQFQIEKALEEAKFEHLMQHKELVTPPFEDAAKLRARAFNKLLLNAARIRKIELTEEERDAYFNVSGSPGQPGQIETIGPRGGYLVPQEQMATLQEFRKKFVALKDYVKVVNTSYVSGRWAIYTHQDLVFKDLDEMTDIPESDVTFSEITYTIKNKFLLIPISNILIDDANIDFFSFIGDDIAISLIRGENEEILKPLNTLITGDTAAGIAEAPTMTSYKSLNTALFKTLNGVYYPVAKIFTNQNGFLWLKNLEDGNNRPLLQPDLTEPGKFLYSGKEIVVVPDDLLPDATIGNKKYAPFFIGDLHSYITFFERQGLEIATSSEMYFSKAGTALRAIARFCAVVTDESAMTALKVEV